MAQLSASHGILQGAGSGLRDEFADVLKGTKTVKQLMDHPTEEPRSGRRVKVADKQSARKSSESEDVASPLEKVREKLEDSPISEREFLDILKFSRLPEAQVVSGLSTVPTLLLVMALEGWDAVTEIAGEFRERKSGGFIMNGQSFARFFMSTMSPSTKLPSRVVHPE